jgi:Putative MetA-pathway of phenol degradation
MTRFRKTVLSGLAALAIGGTAGSASAMEFGTFQNRLNGATIGLPLGALPPAGLYTGLETAYLGMVGNGGAPAGNWTNFFHGISNNTINPNLPAIAQAVPLLYVPEWGKFLGGQYSMSVVFAFYVFSTCNFTSSGSTTSGAGISAPAPNSCAAGPFSGNQSNISSGGFVTANPTFNPINLSWNLGGGWFVSTAFSFMAPIGTRTAGTPNPDYWTLEPALAISYLANNWVISANMFYDINLKSGNTCCVQDPGFQNGNAFYLDFTAAYKFGKWQFGPVAYTELQTNSDRSGSNNTCTGNTVFPGGLCGNYQTVALGGIVGYDFGPVDVQVWVTDQVVGNNTPAGVGSIDVWSRLGFRLWAPEAPVAPLVTKH